MTNQIRKDGSHRWINEDVLAARINAAEEAERKERQEKESSTPWGIKAESAEEASIISRLDRASYGDSINKRVAEARADFERQERIDERLRQKFNPSHGQSEEEFEQQLQKWNDQYKQIVENTR